MLRIGYAGIPGTVADGSCFGSWRVSERFSCVAAWIGFLAWIGNSNTDMASWRDHFGRLHRGITCPRAFGMGNFGRIDRLRYRNCWRMEKHRNKMRIQVVYAVYQDIITETVRDVWQRQFLRIEPNQPSTVLRR